MTEQRSTWDEVRRIADEVELKIHLASMDARDRWRALQPRLTEVERTITAAGKRATSAMERELASISEALRGLRDDLSRPG